MRVLCSYIFTVRGGAGRIFDLAILAFRLMDKTMVYT